MLSFDAYPLYQRLTPAVRTTELANFAKRSDVKRDVEYFRAKAGAAKTPDDFLKDFRLLSFALTAFGLDSQTKYPARAKQILLSDRDDPKSLVNRMTDPLNRQINIAFDFHKSGVKKLTDTKFIDDVVRRFTQQQYEADLGQKNPALQDALYFERNITQVRNGYQIIGDPVLFGVVKTAFNIPNATAGAGKIEKLKEWVEREFPMNKVGDSAFVKKIVSRFLVLKDVESRQDGSGNALLNLFA